MLQFFSRSTFKSPGVDGRTRLSCHFSTQGPKDGNPPRVCPNIRWSLNHLPAAVCLPITTQRPVALCSVVGSFATRRSPSHAAPHALLTAGSPHRMTTGPRPNHISVHSAGVHSAGVHNANVHNAGVHKASVHKANFHNANVHNTRAEI
ncbi:unnamed protein product [Merluccius merluccius]